MTKLNTIQTTALEALRSMANALGTTMGVYKKATKTLVDLYLKVNPEAETLPGLKGICNALGVDPGYGEGANLIPMVSARMFTYWRNELFPEYSSERKGVGGRKAKKGAKKGSTPKLPTIDDILEALPSLSARELGRLERALGKAIAKTA